MGAPIIIPACPAKKMNIHFFFLPAACCLLPIFSFTQTPGEWTWMHGNTPGVFGVQGVPDPANTPPALYEPCEWTDKKGNFWLLGGHPSNVGDYAALWKYDPDPSSPTYNQWTWMKGPSARNQPGVYGIQGIASPANYPGSRAWGTITWVDTLGNLWLFGGGGIDAVGGSGNLNDLWKYDPNPSSPTYNQWTWIKGPNAHSDSGSYGIQGVSSPANLPPSRSETSCSWTDNAGNLWLYGGVNKFLGYLGDLWKYNISINEWTWMHGDSTSAPPPVYGIQGTAAPANTPGGRLVYGSWTDLAGNLWLFGGRGNMWDMFRNDLWKYDPNLSSPTYNQWTWVKGTSTYGNPGNYGTKCVSTNNNIPPYRFENRARVRDGCGNFWNFGGIKDASASLAYTDLWHYNVSSSQWTWVSGDMIPGIPGLAAVYGIRGVSAPANKPGARGGSVAWLDTKGYIWIFGGMGTNSLFRYVPDTNCVPVCNTTLFSTVTYTNVLCNGSCNGTATATPSNGTSPYTYSWSNSQTTQTATGLCAGTYTVIVTNAVPTTATATVTITQPPLLTATAIATNSACGGNNGSAIVNAGGGTPGYTYSWNPFGVTTTTITGLGAGNYTATVTDANGCTATQIVTVVSSGSITATNQSAIICSGSTYTLPGGTIVSTGGIYNDTLTSVSGCDSIIATNLTVNPNPTAYAFSNVTITQWHSVTLTATGGGTYSWSPATGLNCTTCATVTASPLWGAGGLVYCVTVTAPNNCTDTACVTVTNEPIDCSNAGELYLPNAFSPNEDGENDALKIYYGNYACIKTFALFIYNRWGEKVFETTNSVAQWDGSYKGKIESTAVFVYYMEVTLISGEEIIKKGNISLIR